MEASDAGHDEEGGAAASGRQREELRWHVECGVVARVEQGVSDEQGQLGLAREAEQACCVGGDVDG